MALVERDWALDALQELLSGCDRGRGTLVLVSGGVASGKTELLDAFADHATAAGAMVLTATGSPPEQNLQAGVIDQLIRSAPLSDETVERVLRPVTVDSAVPGPDSDPVTIAPAYIVAAQAVYDMLRSLAKAHSVVIQIDDLQFVDTASLQILLYLQRRIRTSRIMMVFAERQPHPRAPARFHAELTRIRHRQVHLPLLTLDGVTQLVAQYLEAATAARLGPELHRLSGGNPMLVKAMLTERRPGQPVSDNEFSQAVLSCLPQWEPRWREIAAGVALLGERTSPALLKTLLDTTAESVAQVLETLRANGLLGSTTFRHPMAVTAVLNSVAPDTRARLHLSAAELLHKQGVSATEVARHLLAADAAEEVWTTGVLRQAATEALAADQAELAVRCLKLALHACPDDETRTEIRQVLAKVEWRANPSVAAMHLAPLHTALREGKVTGRDAVAIVRQLLWQGDPGAEAATIEVLNNIDGSEDSELAAELRLAYEWVYGSSRRLPIAGDRGPGQWVRDLNAVAGDLWTRARVTLNTALTHDSEHVVPSAEQLLQSCPLNDSTLEVAACALLALVYAGRPDRAAVWCGQFAREAAQRDANTWQAVLGSIRAEITLRQGDPAGAAKQARSALGRLPVQSWGVVIGLPLSTLMLAETVIGESGEADSPAKVVVPDNMFDTVFGLRYLHARGRHHLAGGRLLAAANDFQACGSLTKEWNLDLPALIPWRSGLAEAHLRTGRRRTAKDLVTSQLQRPGADTARIQGVSLRVLAAGSELAHRPKLLHKAVESLQESGDRLELARALVDLGSAYEEFGERRRAKSFTRRALREARASNAEEFIKQETAAVVDDALPEPPANGHAPTLSDAERRVAELAARGHTNREISSQLHITVSTVEQHLTRIYRKLGVSGRNHLQNSRGADVR
ncbi:helix-turn-helix transcriptional regulator [Amycolatopsis lurida]